MHLEELAREGTQTPQEFEDLKVAASHLYGGRRSLEVAYILSNICSMNAAGGETVCVYDLSYSHLFSTLYSDIYQHHTIHFCNVASP